MPSSTITLAPRTTTTCERLVTALDTVLDPRSRRGRRFELVAVLALAVTAVVAGAQSFAAIGQWAAEATAEELAAFGFGRHGAPGESTLRKLFARLDATKLDAVIGAWMFTRTTIVSGRRVIAIDGKTVRGARTRKTTAPHLVSAFDTGASVVLGQLQVDAKTNEVPTARTLLSSMDITGAVITMDAMHTQHDTAQAIIAAGGDYVFTVKGNTKTLLAELKSLPWKDIPAHRGTLVGHGARATRTIKVVDAPAWVEFHGATQVAQLRRTVTRDGKRHVEVVYLITSADFTTAPPAVLASWIRDHWHIENRLHWVRDVTFGEDASQVRTGNAPHVMATLRNTTIALLRLAGHTNLAEARRHHARHPDHTTKLVMTS